jgi:hypothetical protein
MGHVFDNGAAIATYSIKGAVPSFAADVIDEEGHDWTSVYSFGLPAAMVDRIGPALPAAESRVVDRVDGYVTIIKGASLGEVFEPPRVCQRPSVVSHAAISMSSAAA